MEGVDVVNRKRRQKKKKGLLPSEKTLDGVGDWRERIYKVDS